MPRLLQRSHPTGTATTSSTSSPVELPPYEAPAYPMVDAGKRSLTELCNHRETRRYEQHLAKSTGYLQESVGAINDVLFARQQTLAGLAKKRSTRGETDKTEAELQLEHFLAELEPEVSRLTDCSEAALREVIDYRAELEDEKQVLQTVEQQVAAQNPRPERKPKVPKRRRRVVSDEDEPDEVEEEDGDVDMHEAEDETPITGVFNILKTTRGSKAEEYGSMSAYQRYGQNNDYISFKKTWHDAQHQGDQIPLPDASTWFDELGRPTKGVTVEDADDDLVVEREITDLRCPLSGVEFPKEPYSNHKCKHTFEKAAIVEHIRTSGGAAQCPVCPQTLRIVDLYPDPVMMRRVRRAEKEAQRNVDDTSDIEPDGEADESLLVGSSANLKREKGRPRRRHEEIKDE
ncbi:zinc-finger of the MIZ type in Nse subunit-domain-containing protein [Apodospora peruviana]|uniref:Zinc-finger of the MIZ type in Nse subunit-domain-containing protein n=1 Tax=Apodospora peruviana TaxID=516989 RepID=A0AAE0I073_9PEZI|nr:zinc-finger of the MIZ type in Nse subunit-domain-containing protein [Apodospora peruviana]